MLLNYLSLHLELKMSGPFLVSAFGILLLLRGFEDSPGDQLMIGISQGVGFNARQVFSDNLK